ncbi:MAG: rhomboid family intramembrane serine protease, partial [Phycisphaerales bacterium]|nr:rhomboid family intramembrane serine protease [Phycisphaerales bacterium]
GYIQLVIQLMLKPTEPQWLNFITYAFMHAGWLHLIGNMVVLWVMGAAVENRLGHVGYLAFYLCAGVLAGLAHMAVSFFPVLGASGAVAGVTGAYLVFFPVARVRMLFLFGFIGVFEVPAWWFVIIGVIKDVYFAVSGGGGNVAFVAHLGGYGAGIVVSVALLAGGLVERQTYDAFGVFQGIARRRRFRAEIAKASGATGDAARSDRWIARPAISDADGAALAEARANISAAVNERRMGDASLAYGRMMQRFPAAGKATTLNARAQLEIANHLFHSGSNASAAGAYQAYAEAYPDDRETPGVRVLLALIALRHLNDPKRAAKALEGVEIGLTDEAHRRLAADLRAELGKLKTA